MLTGLTASPNASTGVAGRSWSTSTPDGWMTTVTRAWTTRSTTDFGPDTCTSAGSDVAVPSWRSAGGVPGTIATLTVRVSRGSISTATTAGSKPRTVIRGSMDRTVTGTLCEPGPAVTLERSTLAWNVDEIARAPEGET